jgi:hypothetical protein
LEVWFQPAGRYSFWLLLLLLLLLVLEDDDDEFVDGEASYWSVEGGPLTAEEAWWMRVELDSARVLLGASSSERARWRVLDPESP